MKGARRREGQAEAGGTGPENGGPVSHARTLGFVLRAMRKELLGLEQGSIVIWLTFQDDHSTGGRRGRE